MTEEKSFSTGKTNKNGASKPLHLRIHETLQPQNSLLTVELICMRNLILLIPGFYADAQGRLYLDMGRFLREHGMQDVPEIRCLVWHEIGCIFGELKVIEITN